MRAIIFTLMGALSLSACTGAPFGPKAYEGNVIMPVAGPETVMPGALFTTIERDKKTGELRASGAYLNELQEKASAQCKEPDMVADIYVNMGVEPWTVHSACRSKYEPFSNEQFMRLNQKP